MVQLTVAVVMEVMQIGVQLEEVVEVLFNLLWVWMLL